MSRPESIQHYESRWKDYADLMEKNEWDNKRTVLRTMIDQIFGAGSHLQVIYENIKSIKDKTYDDTTKSMETNNELREKIMLLAARVDKLERPVSNNSRQLSCQSPYEVSDLYMPFNPSHTTTQRQW